MSNIGSIISSWLIHPPYFAMQTLRQRLGDNRPKILTYFDSSRYDPNTMTGCNTHKRLRTLPYAGLVARFEFPDCSAA